MKPQLTRSRSGIPPLAGDTWFGVRLPAPAVGSAIEAERVHEP